ncbi:MAG TPA: hypothetical protein DD713_09390 [Nitrospiraceae bacterium]|nr:hypothetical protein [Nitrospiraceae bacterium]
MFKHKLLLVFCAISMLTFCYSDTALGGDYIITKWRPSSKVKITKRYKKAATITLKYNGEGSRLINNSCFRATFEDDSTCDGSSGDFNDTRINSRERITRKVYFCETKYLIKDITYACKDSF